MKISQHTIHTLKKELKQLILNLDKDIVCQENNTLTFFQIGYQNMMYLEEDENECLLSIYGIERLDTQELEFFYSKEVPYMIFSVERRPDIHLLRDVLGQLVKNIKNHHKYTVGDLWKTV